MELIILVVYLQLVKEKVLRVLKINCMEIMKLLEEIM